jgi:dTDP-4-amino-4,6-dideoxygalactose transaminase
MKQIPLLDLKLQYATLRDEIDRAVADVVASQGFVLGPVVQRFEEDVAAFVGCDHAIGCASGTDALILALAALDIGPGDEVLTSPFSFFASASCAYKVGARPRFADIDAETFNLDPQSVADSVTAKTRALLPVHLFGQCAAMDSLLEIAAGHDIPVVEDAAQALSATYRSRSTDTEIRAGAIGRLGCYSFFPSKNLGGFGDGGMIVTADDELAARLRLLRVHGGNQTYEHRIVGWNSRLDALQAAVLAVKLPHLDRWSAARVANADRYDRWLDECGLVSAGRVRTPRRDDSAAHIFNQYTLRVERRDELREHLSSREIGHSVYYPVPLHLQECFRELGYRPGSLPRAEQAAHEVISLPIFPELTDLQQQRVVDALAEFYAAG